MKINLQHKGKTYEADLDLPLDISIPLKNGMDNPNCYYADPVEFEIIRSGDFKGSVAEGGPVNYQKVKMTPHGNGTHTECYGHLTAANDSLNTFLKRFHFIAQLISVTPKEVNGDHMILLSDIKAVITDDAEAVIIRTLPNPSEKLTRKYSGTNPPYLDGNIGEFLKEKGIKHLLTDLPSVDREVDAGALTTHRSFWNMGGEIRKDATITELIYVDNSIPDGIYLLNLQITALEMDASPSKPVLFHLKS